VVARFKSRNSEGHIMQLATCLIVESSRRSYTVLLRRPMALADIYYHFVRRYRRPQIATLSGHIARITLP